MYPQSIPSKEINITRVKRIAEGSGTSVSAVRDLLKHHKQTKKMMGMIKDPSNMPDMENMNPQEMMKMMKKSGMGKGIKGMMGKK